MQIETEVFETLPFSDREIISLFGNVLDNALEACERIQDKKRWIKIKIKKKNHLLYIETSNAIKENAGAESEGICISKRRMRYFMDME